MSDTLETIDFYVDERAKQLQMRIDDLLASLGNEYGDELLDASKNLLETVFRTIIVDKKGAVEEGRRAATFDGLYRQATECVVLSGEEEAADKINQMCKSAVEGIGYLRNKYGKSSHGRDGYIDRHISIQEALFVARFSLGITNLLYGKHLSSPVAYANSRVRYEDYSDFNEYIDDLEGDDVMVAGISIRPSQALFDCDNIAYKEKLIEYMQLHSEDGDALLTEDGEPLFA